MAYQWFIYFMSDTSDNNIPIELGLDKRTSSHTHRAALIGALQQLYDSSGERLYVVRVYQETGLTVNYEVDDATDSRCHNRQSTSHCLEQNPRRYPADSWKDEDISRLIDGRQVLKSHTVVPAHGIDQS